MIPVAVLAIDGGGMTGLARLQDHGQAFFADEFPPLEAACYIEANCAYYRISLTIVCERYDIRTRLPQTHAYDAIGINFAARWMADRYGCRLVMAQQHTPKPHERKELEAIGWWTPAKNDAQSAAWHLLAWLRQTHNVPPGIAAKLSEARTTL